ncbi:hypothetical protein SS50377_25174 [Spironucleus salmonicida]|nr:hypothetical protein SS50377_25174 [Spironucleus salmonicida]
MQITPSAASVESLRRGRYFASDSSITNFAAPFVPGQDSRATTLATQCAMPQRTSRSGPGSDVGHQLAIPARPQGRARHIQWFGPDANPAHSEHEIVPGGPEEVVLRDDCCAGTAGHEPTMLGNRSTWMPDIPSRGGGTRPWLLPEVEDTRFRPLAYIQQYSSEAERRQHDRCMPACQAVVGTRKAPWLRNRRLPVTPQAISAASLCCFTLPHHAANTRIDVKLVSGIWHYPACSSGGPVRLGCPAPRPVARSPGPG